MSPSDLDALRQRIIGDSSDRIRFYATRGKHLLHVALTTRDGDRKEVGAFVSESRLGLIVSDGGDAWNALYMDDIVRGLPTPTQLRRVRALARGFRVVFDRETSALMVRTAPQDVTEAVHRVGAAMIALDAWRFFR